MSQESLLILVGIGLVEPALDAIKKPKWFGEAVAMCNTDKGRAEPINRMNFKALAYVKAERWGVISENSHLLQVFFNCVTFYLCYEKE